jgi:adenine-specific DNA-methyltransferase
VNPPPRGEEGPRRRQAPARGGPHHERSPRPQKKPPLRLFTTTLWEYPSQHYELDLGPEITGEAGPRRSSMQGDKAYAGATPSWVIWQCLQRYTREGDLVVDPMCGSGTTLDVARDLKRRALGYDLTPHPARPDIFRADARKLPLEDAKADFVFIDPPYSTHIRYSDDPKDIGSLDASGDDGGEAYYDAMARTIAEIHRVLKNRRYMALYVSDSWRKRTGGRGDSGGGAGGGAVGSGTGTFMPIGFELFSILRRHFKPVDIIAVVRHNQKLQRGNWHKAAEEGNFFLRGFNYLFIMKKEESPRPPGREPTRRHGGTEPL